MTGNHHAADAARKHEDFKNRLVDDVLGKEAGRVPMEKVVMLLWQFRDDPAVVQFMAQFVAKYAGSHDVFDGIEFYLPQLAHMIIHLEVSWDDAILERFALIVAQQSLHFALQLNWILRGAIEDYQPENVDGTPNDKYNSLFYSRCVKLLSNIERCVVYGTPRTHELQRLYEMGKISKNEYELMEHADRRFNAAQIIGRGQDENRGTDGALGVNGSGAFGGDLLYKRKVRSAMYKRKQWKTRYFAVMERMLYCFNVHPNKGGTLRRAMPLEGADIGEPSEHKYPHMFYVKNQLYMFVIRAGSADEKKRWLGVLREESEANTLIPHKVGGQQEKGKSGEAEAAKASKDDEDRDVIRELTQSQRSRYDFFKEERDFVFNMCNVAEDLRFKKPPERKKLAPGLMESLDIPRCCYVPMCNSSHTFQRVQSTIPKDTRVFNTNERCPVIMHFVTKRGETLHNHRGHVSDANLDVAEYLRLAYEVPDESASKTTKPKMGGIEEGDEEAAEAEGEEGEEVKADVFFSCKGDMDVGQVGLARLCEEEEEAKTEEGNEKGSNGAAAAKEGEDGAHGGSNLTEGAMLWKDEAKEGNDGEEETNKDQRSAQKGNIRVQRLIRENLVNMPQNLAKRMVSRKNIMAGSIVEKIPKMSRDRDRDREGGKGGHHHHQKSMGHHHKSYLDRAVGTVDSVPIVEGQSIEDGGGDDQSVGSIGTGSVLTREGDIVHTDEGYSGIDRESLERAKAIVCRGESWSDKSARLLREEEEARRKDGGSGGAAEEPAICTEIVGVMAKSNDDLRQEVFIMQMIHFYKSVFAKARLPIWLKTYRILSTAQDTGLIEVITDSTSIDGLKKSEGFPEEGGMRAYFEKVYGPPTSESFKAAQRNFMLSLVGYSLMSFLLGLKDRHNGNIMIDLWGHLIHIDFGFVMGMAPGHEFSFERAPFKITQDYVDVMGGTKSECFAEFRRLFVAGFEAARRNSLVALGLVEIMMFKSNYPCFTGSRYGHGRALNRFEKRLMLNKPDKDIPKLALGLIDQSIGNEGTYIYDRFQLYSNGYAM
mmetsp:Transcript_20823/g.60616  ORF Transcript_20823/g.60616 Transcript_20823/m.60616 type:complete len:1047 (-) Transcript_20823:479-3619(-)|eukprot:CAMPEP_0113543204 /NCGR_PEP_ID=MMETSP0015_2-20120614/10032_1 /TAXON_ID=2838 /ORGANISM="Odontella" /LENGTH=1046 /DNA_ID=CAMNT_0000443345 /DNA_START=387 /DNA_END=3527 /DNA_ORIENTATION=+ /assembly_acc=CAM_ASM_000160